MTIFGFMPYAAGVPEYLIALFAGLYIMLMFVAIAVSVAAYVFQALGVKAMLKSVGFKRAWYAFVPFCNSYAIGYLADQYDDGKAKTNYASKLLKLCIIVLILGEIFLSFWFLMIILRFVMAPGSMFVMYGAIIAIALSYIAMMVVSIIYSVKLTMAFWRIYRVFAPEQSVLFLLLSIFVSATPITFFIIRNREPQNLRTEEAPVYTQEPTQD